MTPITDTAKTAPFPKIKDDMVARLYDRARDIATDSTPTPKPDARKRFWFN